METHSFNKVAHEYTARVSPYRYAQFLALLHELNFEGNEKVLDIGCGPGVLSIEAANRLPDGHLTGIDLSPNMIKLAEENAQNLNIDNTEFVTGDALALDFEDETFDIVFSSNAFPWVANQEHFLKETYRVLKPHGKLGLISLSDLIYREFMRALRHVLKRNPNLFPREANPYKLMKFKAFGLEELGRKVARAEFDVYRSFQLTTEEPILPRDYLNRVNAIVDENYLEGFTESNRKKARNEILLALARQNGALTITESSVFVLAYKI